MKLKRLFQLFVLLAIVFSPIGSVQHAQARSSRTSLDPVIIPRDLSLWNATYIGFVSASIFEKWQFVFNESHNFTVTVSSVTGDLVPLLILLDGNGNEITRSISPLASNQPAGNYSIQVQPDSGSGFYILTLREVVQTQPSVSTLVSPASLNVGETATVTVDLGNVPAEGYTSAEFTCTYDPGLVEVSNIAATNLFGADSAVAINGPQNGSFIVAVAGSNGNKATSSGTAFAFSVKALQAGQTSIECTARVSKGDNILTSLSSSAASLTILGNTPTPTETFTPGPSPTPTETFTPGPSPTPTETFTPGPSPTPTETFTPGPSPTGTLDTATPTDVSSPTPTALPPGSLTGQVNASKPVTISLYNADNTLTTSTTANADGTFSLTAPAGTYTVIATASGFLSAQGTKTLSDGQASTMPTISLPAGDIDGNGVIDQFDAMTIGMSYNTALPAAADLNNDGTINVLDLELLAANYRKAGALAWQ